jgi:carbon-monoxide dehydrogenase large subunit
MPFRTGHEGVTVRMDPSGAVTVLAVVTSQGQGLETTMAQLAAGELGVPVESVRVVLGDTDATPFGLGAFASRQAVIGGGAAIRAARAVRDKALRIAAHVLEAAVEDMEITDGSAKVKGAPGRALAMEEIARIAHLETHRLPSDTEPGLDATRFYDPIRGTFAAGAQAAIVEVEPETGTIAIRRWVCVEDTGRIINPLIVEGQVHGAIAQGIGGALAEHLIYDEAGQLLTGSLMTMRCRPPRSCRPSRPSTSRSGRPTWPGCAESARGARSGRRRCSPMPWPTRCRRSASSRMSYR